jgi:hypothetical protein
VASNVCIAIINSTWIVIIAINWGVGTSSVRVTIIKSTFIVVIARNSRFVATSVRVTRVRYTIIIVNTNYNYMGTTNGGIAAI